MRPIPAVGRSAMRWSCLQFNVLLLPESYRRLPAETRWKPLSSPPLHGQGVTLKTILNLDHTQRTRHQCDFPILPWFYPVWRFHLVAEWVSTIHGCTHSWRFWTFYSLFTRKKNARERKKEDVRISHQTENQKENVGVRTRYVYTWYPLLF